MNTKRLLTLAAHLESIPPEKRHHFNMRTWAFVPQGEVPTDANEFFNTCGTAACALGTACLIPAFKRAGLRMHVSVSGRMVPSFDNERGYFAAVSFFDISYLRATELFNPAYYPVDYPTVTMVAGRIRDMVAKHEINV